MPNGHGRNPRGGGGGNPNQPRSVVALVPTRIDATTREIDVKVTVTRGGAALAAGQVIFSRGANPELNGLVALDADGTKSWTYKNVPNVDVVKLKVEMADGSGWREIEVPIPAKPTTTAPTFEGYMLHYHVVRVNPTNLGHIRLVLSVRDGNEMFKAGKIRMAFGHTVQLDGVAIPAGTIVTKDVPDTGLTMDVVFTTYQLKAEVFVEGLNKIFDFTILGMRPRAPRAQAGDGILAYLISEWDGANPSLRLWFAWLPIATILAVWLGGIVRPVFYAMIAFVGFAFFIRKGGELRANSWNLKFGSVMSTNNAWWGTWLTTSVLCLIIALTLSFCGPAAPAPIEANNGPLSTSQQLDRNEQIYGKRLTDRQVESRRKLGLLPAPKKEVATGLTVIDQSTNWLGRNVLPDRSGTGWFIRLFVLVLSFLGTFGYAFVAFREEVQELTARRREQQSGQPGLLDRILQTVGGGSKNPPKRGGDAHHAPFGLPGWFFKILMADEIFELVRFVIKFFKR